MTQTIETVLKQLIRQIPISANKKINAFLFFVYILLKKRETEILYAQNINTKEYWDNIWKSEGLKSRTGGKRNQKIIDLIPNGSTILDVGCGNGQLLTQIMFNKNNCICYGIDISDSLANELQYKNIIFKQVILPHIPYGKNFFDVVICGETLEHVPYPEETVKSMVNVVKKGGLIITSVPEGELWGVGEEHINSFTASELLKIFQPYSDSITIEFFYSGEYPYLLSYFRKKDNISCELY